MTANPMIEIVSKLVEVLTPLASEDRMRVIGASLALLGESKFNPPPSDDGGINDVDQKLPPRALAWMKQNNLSMEQLSQVFHFNNGRIEIIGVTPGKDTKERALNSYILKGTANLLETGEPNFDDKSARAVCATSGCYDPNNHSSYLKGKGNGFTGSKEKGWTLTAPGLKQAAAIVAGFKVG